MSLGSSEIILDQLLYYIGDQRFYFNARIPEKSITAIVGPSGAGKSTLISLLGGFVMPYSGQLWIGKQDITRCAPADRPLSILFQENNLFSHLNVFDNIALACNPTLKLTATEQQVVDEMIQQMGLAGKASCMPDELSGGQKQRVALGRTLLRDKPVIILDEPFSALGPGLRHELLALLLSVHKEKPFTLLFVTHEPQDILFLNGDVLFIEEGQILVHGNATKILCDQGALEVKKYLGLS